MVHDDLKGENMMMDFDGGYGIVVGSYIMFSWDEETGHFIFQTVSDDNDFSDQEMYDTCEKAMKEGNIVVRVMEVNVERKEGSPTRSRIKKGN